MKADDEPNDFAFPAFFGKVGLVDSAQEDATQDIRTIVCREPEQRKGKCDRKQIGW